MAAEKKRGCGYRKIGGTYLVSGTEGFGCGRMPLELAPCPLCDHRPPFTRGLQRITPKNIVHASPICEGGDARRCAVCPLGKVLEVETAGLMWVGGKFYTPETFAAEASEQGISKRIPSVPKWLKVGETWVFLAHEQTISLGCEPCQGSGQVKGLTALLETCELCQGDGTIHRPGVFRAFVPRRIERIIPDTMPEDERVQLREQGLTLVEVPHDDPDHQAVKGRKDEEE